MPAPALLPTSDELQSRIQDALAAARAQGASAAEASVSASRGLTLSVRKGEVESLEFQHDRDLGITVYFGQRKGNASTGDLSPAGIVDMVHAACEIARATGEDPCNGLADAERMATLFPDLDLDHPWSLTAEEAIDLARQCEAAAFAVDARITQTEGASLSSHRGISIYGNTHGFVGERHGTHHSVSCAVVATQGDEMQRDYWYTSARRPADMLAVEAVGRRAGERTVGRLGSRKLGTRKASVLLPPEIARGFWGHYLSAMSGAALYRKASFLLGKLQQPVFSTRVQLEQQPFIPCGASSAAWDHEGVATENRVLVQDGVLQGWLLGSYSARKLGLKSTGNAGGVFNLIVRPGTQSFDELVRDMGEGLIVTELLGHGVNGVTGDYSRGAAGYWVENGQIAYPVQELTIAGSLLEMAQRVAALGADVDPLAGTRTGSVLIEGMTIAGG